jgi:hypothetical protein
LTDIAGKGKRILHTILRLCQPEIISWLAADFLLAPWVFRVIAKIGEDIELNSVK